MPYTFTTTLEHTRTETIEFPLESGDRLIYAPMTTSSARGDAWLIERIVEPLSNGHVELEVRNAARGTYYTYQSASFGFDPDTQTWGDYLRVPATTPPGTTTLTREVTEEMEVQHRFQAGDVVAYGPTHIRWTVGGIELDSDGRPCYWWSHEDGNERDRYIARLSLEQTERRDSDMELMRAHDGRFAVGDLVEQHPNHHGYQFPARVNNITRNVDGRVMYEVENVYGVNWTFFDDDSNIWRSYGEPADPEPEEPPFTEGDIVTHRDGGSRRVVVDGVYVHRGEWHFDGHSDAGTYTLRCASEWHLAEPEERDSGEWRPATSSSATPVDPEPDTGDEEQSSPSVFRDAWDELTSQAYRDIQENLGRSMFGDSAGDPDPTVTVIDDEEPDFSDPVLDALLNEEEATAEPTGDAPPAGGFDIDAILYDAAILVNPRHFDGEDRIRFVVSLEAPWVPFNGDNTDRDRDYVNRMIRGITHCVAGGGYQRSVLIERDGEIVYDGSTPDAAERRQQARLQQAGSPS